MVGGLLTSMATAGQLLYVRVPALNALFPDYRGSLLDALGSIMHDHGLWVTADVYPRYTCDYGTPPHRRRRTIRSRTCTPTAATTIPRC